MVRATSAVQKRQRHKKTINDAKGYYGHKSIGYKSAKEQVRQSNEYAFRDRKQVKREFRKLWIKRINAATREYDLSYSHFIYGLKKANIKLDRKMLADIALNNKKDFKDLVEISKHSLNDQNIIN